MVLFSHHSVDTQNAPLNTGQMVSKLDCTDVPTSTGKRNGEWVEFGKSQRKKKKKDGCVYKLRLLSVYILSFIISRFSDVGGFGMRQSVAVG